MLSPALALGHGTFANVLMEFSVKQQRLTSKACTSVMGRPNTGCYSVQCRSFNGGEMLILAHAHIS